MNIAVIGSGYVGLVAGACFAELGHEVVLVDNDPLKYAALARGECPIHEEHLPELLARHRGKRLTFSDCLPVAVRASRAVFIAVGTPPTHNGEADLSYVESVARAIAGAVNDYKVIVGKSTVRVAALSDRDRRAQPVRSRDHARARFHVSERWSARRAVEGSESAEGNGGGPGMRQAEEAPPGSRLLNITAGFDVER